MEETKVSVYNREDLDWESKQSNLFVKKTQPAINIDSTPTQVQQRTPVQPSQSINDLSALAETFAASMSLIRLPVPEPTVFDGDPLKYNDWSIAFKALIEDKRISKGDQIHYLKRYISGPAREAISGYFLLRSDSAIERAKVLLEECCGNQFIVMEAFRDKLEAWPKIHGRDGNSHRQFSDFLNHCQAAMMDMKGLEILNDNRENRKLLQKLPNWVVNHWSRIVSASWKGMYPSFGQFTEFITEEASIACDPVTSLGSLRGIPEQEEKEREKGTRMNERKKRNHAATTLASDTQDNESLSSFLCKRNSHVLAECRTFGIKPVGEK